MLLLQGVLAAAKNWTNSAAIRRWLGIFSWLDPWFARCMKAHASAPFGKQSDARGKNTSSFLTVNETAVLLRVSVRTLQKLMRRGLPFYAPVPHRRLFLQTEVEEWLRNNSRHDGEATLNTKPANTPPSRGKNSDPLSGEPRSPIFADQPPDEPSHQEPECLLVQSTFVAEMPATENKNNEKPAAIRRTANKIEP